MGWHFYRPDVDSNLGTSLPANPVDGQEFTLVDSLSAPTWSWKLRYVAAKSSNKWIHVGGHAVDSVTASESKTGATYGNLTTTGPSITVPVAGIYVIEIGLHMQAAGGWSAFMSYDIGASAAVDADCIFDQPGTEMAYWSVSRKTLSANTALVTKYKADGTHSASFRDRIIRVTPVAVGG